MINEGLHLTAAILLPILLCIGMIVLFHRKFKSPYGFLVGLILGAFLFAFFQVGFNRVYIIKDKKEYSIYRYMGDQSYTMQNGTVVTIPGDHRLTFIINDSKRNVIVDEIDYKSENALDFHMDDVLDILKDLPGYVAPEEEKMIIPSGEFALFDLNKQQIDYFFSDPIPREIETYGTGNNTKNWLHYTN